MALRSGFWDPTFLVVIPVLTFTFAILYAVSTLAAVSPAARSWPCCCRSGSGCSSISSARPSRLRHAQGRWADERAEWASRWWTRSTTFLPRYKDLDKLTSKLIAEGR